MSILRVDTMSIHFDKESECKKLEVTIKQVVRLQLLQHYRNKRSCLLTTKLIIRCMREEVTLEVSQVRKTNTLKIWKRQNSVVVR
jgi:hypothetical protein